MRFTQKLQGIGVGIKWLGLEWKRRDFEPRLDGALPGAGIMPTSPLSAAEITSRLQSLAAWQVEGGELVRTFSFTDFRAALAFVNQVGELAEAAGHHPDIDIRYNKVRLALVTHDSGGLTAKDFDLAGRINATQKA
jgi:4a-hydroxytetrahydrobiopterin dehydratase